MHPRVIGKNYSNIDVAVLLSYLICYVLHLGRLTYLIGDASRTAVLGLEILTLGAGAALCALRRSYSPLLWAAAGFAYIVFQANLFAYQFGATVNYATLAQFLPMFSFLVFIPCLIAGRFEKITSLMLVISAAYSAFYILLTLGISSGALSVGAGAGSLVISADASSGRPDRVVMLGDIVALGGALAIARALDRKKVGYLALFVMCSLAIWMSHSRTFTAIYVLAVLVYIALRSTKVMALVTISVFTLIGGWLIVGLFSNDLFPFTIINPYDSSAIVRDMSYEAVRRIIENYWITGVGLATDQGDVIELMGTKMFFSADLGIVGVVYEWGVIGALIYFALHVLFTLANDSAKRVGFSKADANGLGTVAAAMVAFGVISPTILVTCLTGLFAALAMRSFVAGRTVARSAPRPDLPKLTGWERRHAGRSGAADLAKPTDQV